MEAPIVVFDADCTAFGLVDFCRDKSAGVNRKIRRRSLPN
jgi:hypothetical protein